jgi:putative addiction module component (TIGR02574 family)
LTDVDNDGDGALPSRSFKSAAGNRRYMRLKSKGRERKAADQPRYTEFNQSYWTRFMAKPVPLPPPGFDDLSVDEKIDYLQSLWDRLAASPETIPVPDWHREVLDERVKDLEANPHAGDSWEAVQERLRKTFDSRH